MKVGIPAGLLYHYYYPAWRAFFTELGHEVVTSGPTTKAIIDKGILFSAPEACVPIKAFTGHVIAVASRDDVAAVFVPRHCSLEPRFHFCPKIMGLPDMIRHTVVMVRSKLFLEPWIDLRHGVDSLKKPAGRVAVQLGGSTKSGLKALEVALAVHKESRSLALSGLTLPEVFMKLGGHGSQVASDAQAAQSSHTTPIVGVLGYPYNIYDRFLAMDMVGKLKSLGIAIKTFEMTDYMQLRQDTDYVDRSLFWTFSDWIYRAGLEMIRTKSISGVIHVTSFGCGPDAIVGKLLDLEAKTFDKPYLTMRIDEHTGDSHLATRLEAFADVVRERGYTL